MKHILALFVLLTITGLSNAQILDPVKWTFTSKKIDAKTYEIRLIANIQMGWHLYSQTQPKDAIINPTEIAFIKNPLVSLDGKAKENGKMELYTDKRLGISANQYSNQVEFVQKVRLKAASKTNISGSVEYQTCDDKKCLPPKKVKFNLALK
jgi:hypothetical protein